MYFIKYFWGRQQELIITQCSGLATYSVLLFTFYGIVVIRHSAILEVT